MLGGSVNACPAAAPGHARAPRPGYHAHSAVAVVKALRAPGIAERIVRQGLDIVANRPEEFAAFLAADVAEWREVVKTAGIEPS